MDPWWVQILISIIGAGTIGSVVTALVASRRNHSDDRQALIDQLQEERKAFVDQLAEERDTLAAERATYEARIDIFWRDKAASREHVGALTDHIWQRKPPPPPTAPIGYIP